MRNLFHNGKIVDPLKVRMPFDLIDHCLVFHIIAEVHQPGRIKVTHPMARIFPHFIEFFSIARHAP